MDAAVTVDPDRAGLKARGDGAKHSGYGLEFGVEGLESVSVPQVING